MMRRFYLILAFALAAGAGAAAEGWDDLYAARLNAQAAWLESKLALASAEVAYDQYIKPLLPTISVATTTSTALSIGGSGFDAGVLIPSITLENLFGADLSLKAPLKATSAGGIGLGDPSVSLTRQLFVETEADRLDAEAAVMMAREAIRNSENAVRIALATDILNAMYYKRLLAADKENLGVLEKMKKATIDINELRVLDRHILETQKSILLATASLADVDDGVKENANALYADLLRLQAGWIAVVGAKEPKSSMTIQALELSLKAAEKRGAFSILPYLPNPNLTASLSYDIDKSALAWGLSFTMSFNAIDKGQHALSVLKRRDYPQIYRIKLADARKSLVDNIRKTNDKLLSLELDKEIKKLDIADAEDIVRIFEELYKGRFTSEENLIIRQIDLSVQKLLAQKIEYDILIQNLNVAHYYSAGD